MERGLPARIRRRSRVRRAPSGGAAQERFIEQERLDEVGDKDQPVAVYCRSGNRSGKAARMLEAAGYKAVYDLGGLRSARRVVEGGQ